MVHNVAKGSPWKFFFYVNVLLTDGNEVNLISGLHVVL